MLSIDFPIGITHCGDCLEVLPALPEKSIDLILCDPPYAVTSAAFDKALDLKRLWPQLWRLARPHCPVILTAVQPFSSILTASQIDHFKHEWVWIKNRGSNFANTVREPMKEHEHVLVFARSPWTYNKQMQERTGGGLSRVQYNVAFKTASENYHEFEDHDKNKLPDLRVPSSWQKFNCEVGLHPQQKPVDLFRYLIRTYSDAGMTVLDFTGGSGTTAIAAMREGRQFIYIEKEQRFFESAKDRIRAEHSGQKTETMQPSLFGAE
jgi:site-specific DNA-methyltransferase (adenine-specific)